MADIESKLDQLTELVKTQSELMSAQSEELATLRRKHDDAISVQKETLEKMSRKRSQEATKPEKLDRAFLDVQFQLNAEWHKRLKQGVDSDTGNGEDLCQAAKDVMESIEARMNDLRLGDKDLAYLKFADEMRALKKIRMSGGDTEVAEAWTKLRASEGFSSLYKDSRRTKQPFRRGRGNQHIPIVAKQERIRRQCYKCQGYGHFQADCPQATRSTGGDKPIV